MLQIDYNAILNDLIKLIVPFILGGGVYLLKQVVGQKRFEKIAQQLESKNKLAQLAVQFAEQAFKDLDGTGKFAKAESYMVDFAKAQGLKMSEADIKAHIESAVLVAKKEVVKDAPVAIKQVEAPQQPAK